MKTNYPLLARVAHPENLRAAWLRVRGKGSAGGIDGVGPEDLASRASDWLHKLHQELTSQTYTPEPLLRLSIPKPSKPNERRALALPTVRDKVAQEAARRVIEPILDHGFSDCSYGYRAGKGPQKAVRRVLHHIQNRKCEWVVTADIDDFFGSLNQDLLLRRLGEAVQDQAVVRLLELWLRMGTVDTRGRWRDVYSGVGQGGVISPLLANFYLDPFDRFLTSEGPDFGLVRYSDDFVVLTPTRTRAEEAMEKTTRFLRDELFLRLNPCDRPVAPVPESFTFLGLRFEGPELRIDPDKVEKIERKLRSLCSRFGTEPPEKTVRALNESIAGWKRYYGALVPPSEMGRIEGLLAAALGGQVRRCLEGKVFRSVAEALGVLDGLELPTGSDPRARRKLARHLVHQARAARAGKAEGPAEKDPAHEPSPRVEAPAADKAEGRPAPSEPQPERAEGAAEPAEAHAAEAPKRSVAAAVRRRKGRHFREQTHRSELVLATPGTFLGRSGDRLVMRRERRIVQDAPALHVRSITIAEHGVSLSADVIAHCAEHAIPILVVDPLGRVKALLSAPASGAADLHGCIP